ncbi:MAG: SAM-dependent methyltransferase [Bacteroidota bacterium]
MSPELQQFSDQTHEAATTGHLTKLTLSKPRKKSPDHPKNLYARPVDLKGKTHLQVTYRYPDREEVKNYDPATGSELLTTALGTDFLNADLFTTEEHVSIALSRKGNARVQKRTLHSRTRPQKTKEHNREKQRDISTDRPYLHALGVTTAEGKIRQDGKRKFKQINKFVEIIDGLVKEHPLRPGAQIVDMGSGSGYLTFALYDHLTNTLGLDVTVTGVELRPKLVEKCRTIAAENGFKNLHFVEGYIDDFQPPALDLLIALHACDTATDDALYQGLQAQAEIMVVAPCCQKQVRRDLEIPADLKPLLGNGILLERQAAMLTDGLRALYLEAEGYQTKLFEFIPLEHTAKNVMITAVKGRKRLEASAEIAALKQRFGVTRHRLEELITRS